MSTAVNPFKPLQIIALDMSQEAQLRIFNNFSLYSSADDAAYKKVADIMDKEMFTKLKGFYKMLMDAKDSYFFVYNFREDYLHLHQV